MTLPNWEGKEPEKMSNATHLVNAAIAAVVVAAVLLGVHTSAVGGDSTTSTAPVTPDMCTGAIDPYLGGAERMRFFIAAGVDNELDAGEFAANASKARSFVRKFDRFEAMLAFDKNRNKTIDWFEADSYRRSVRARVLAAFDKNGNGRLGGAERAAANLALAAGRIPGGKVRPTASAPARSDKAQQHVARIIKKYDADGDGKISDKELAAMGRNFRGRRRHRQRELELRHFDADADGELSKDEKEELEKFSNGVKGIGWTIRGRLYDRDGDGRISARERELFRKEMAAVGPRLEQGMNRLADADGDGKVSRVERIVFRDRMQQEWQRLVADYVGQYDADGNGRLGPAERRELLKGLREDLKARCDYYDVNGDGALSAEEAVNLSLDWMERIITPGRE